MAKAFLIRFLLFVAVYFMLLAACLRADDFSELKEVSIDYKNFKMINPNARNPIIWPEVPKEGLNLIIDTDLVWGLMYAKAEVESLTTDAQYRAVGLQARLGFHILDSIDLGLYHHSQHVLDEVQPGLMGFPEEDAVELKIYLYKRRDR